MGSAGVRPGVSGLPSALSVRLSGASTADTSAAVSAGHRVSASFSPSVGVAGGRRTARSDVGRQSFPPPLALDHLRVDLPLDRWQFSHVDTLWPASLDRHRLPLASPAHHREEAAPLSGRRLAMSGACRVPRKVAQLLMSKWPSSSGQSSTQVVDVWLTEARQRGLTHVCRHGPQTLYFQGEHALAYPQVSSGPVSEPPW